MKESTDRKPEEKLTEELEIMRENFRLLRQSKNWSITELSQISGIDEKILTAIENGEDFEVQYLIILCCVYRIKPYEIFLRRGI